MTPRIGGVVMTDDGRRAEYRGTIQPHGMALVRFEDDGTFAYRETTTLRILRASGIVKARDLVDVRDLRAQRFARMLTLPSSAREGDR